jgi:hypothetical protein
VHDPLLLKTCRTAAMAAVAPAAAAVRASLLLASACTSMHSAVVTHQYGCSADSSLSCAAQAAVSNSSQQQLSLGLPALTPPLPPRPIVLRYYCKASAV